MLKFGEKLKCSWEFGVLVTEEKDLGFKSTQVAINLTNVIDYADAQALPVLFQTLERIEGYSLTQLGWISSIRSLLQAVATPIFGYFADKYSRKKVLIFASIFWGVFTLLCALSWNYMSLLFFRALVGIGLAAIVPTSFSLIADFVSPDKRGKSYGILGLTGVVGVIFGSLLASIIAPPENSSTVLGLTMWRWVLIIFAIVSFLIAIIVFFFLVEPERGKSDGMSLEYQEKYKIEKSDFVKILKNKTFMIIVFQGMLGTIPWAAILFIVDWLGPNNLGFSAFQASILFALIAMGAAGGNLIGGLLGDRAAKWNADKGRILIAQFSVLVGVPLLYIILKLLPRDTSTSGFLLYMGVGFFTGLLITWPQMGTNNPIFSELFTPELRASAFSVDRVFEGGLGAFGFVIVGWVAEKFGYVNLHDFTPGTAAYASQQLANIDHLADAMLWVMAICWTLCFLLYIPVYFTYPGDRDRTKADIKKRIKELKN